MATKFFNNINHSLFDKLKGIAGSMSNFDRFLAVAGFFRSSGYFKLRSELDNVDEIKILVGINVDEIFRKHNKALLMLAEPDKAKDLYKADFCDDVIKADYSPEVEAGILQMFDDLSSGRLQMRIHPTKNLHAKFYLCLPHDHNENSDGWVIMGSSNISDSGLGLTIAPRYELNVAMKDYDDVKYCLDEFNKLWEESVPLTDADIEKCREKTYLGYQPTPYEIYIKVLIDTFGDQVEDFSKPKIVWAETMRRHRTTEERFPRFSYDDKGFFLDKTCFMAISNDADFIVVFLNSYIGEYLCGKYVSILDNGGYLMQKIYLENIPVPHFDDSIVEKIATLKNTDEEALETYLAQMIGFTDEEYAYIRGNTGKLQPILYT